MNRFLLAAFAALIPLAAQAQNWPTKPIRLVVPFAPGGSSSIVARAVGVEMEKKLGQPIVIDNRPGGGGNVAMQEVARAEPDGYTLIIGHIGTFAVNPFMFETLPFDTNRDFTAVSLLVKVPNIFVVHADVPAKDLREFVALMKNQPGKLFYGSAGNGSAGHLIFEYLKLLSGADIVHVPYKGTGPNLTDLLAGRTQATSAGTPPLMPHVKAGKLRAIAVAGDKRLPALPDVGTVAEQGFPGFEATQWYGINAPAKTPAAVIKRLADEAAMAVKQPSVLERFAADDAEGIGSTPEEYAAFIAAEQKRWGEVVRKANIKAK
ncbi:MAG TPA: tripartite tricarboxylate transporter substrate binding protein [Burkholderiales bacterium]|jgi:tripartite-type tricarboxylate transporter receptor subunit TctC|nr:tripartite tricarboxylate transporter substrate binding protein [Burkholderiales bacterium]